MTVAAPYRITAKDLAIQSPLIVLGVALSPLSLLPTPKQPSWLERADNPCVETGEAAPFTAENKKDVKNEAVALAGLIVRRQQLTGRCLLFVSSTSQSKDLNRRMGFTAAARLRFEERACVENDGQAETTWRWNLPREDQMDEAGVVTWPEELRQVLNDPATFDYPGLMKVCLARGGVRADLTEAIQRSREAWPLPTAL